MSNLIKITSYNETVAVLVSEVGQKGDSGSGGKLEQLEDVKVTDPITGQVIIFNEVLLQSFVLLGIVLMPKEPQA